MGFFNIPPDLLGIIAAVLGVGIANKLDLNEQNSIGNFLQSIGQTILVVNAQDQLQQEQQQQQEQQEQLKLQMELLQKQMEFIKNQIKD